MRLWFVTIRKRKELERVGFIFKIKLFFKWMIHNYVKEEMVKRVIYATLKGREKEKKKIKHWERRSYVTYFREIM